jgi:hypothetical protein
MPTVVAVALQRRARGVLDLDQPIPGVVDELPPGFVLRQVAVGIIGWRDCAPDTGDFVLGVMGAGLRAAVGDDALPVAVGVTNSRSIP